MSKLHAQHWGIVGGGIMGLTLAKRLADAGQRVTLIEAAPEIGGLASAWDLGHFTWDRHYHVTLLSDQFTRAMLQELSLEQEMQWVETKTGFFTDGKLYSMSNSWEFLSFPPLNLLEKLRLGFTIFYASKIRNWKPLEDVPVAEWLQRWSGAGTFRKIWLPLLQAKLGDAYRRVSAAFIWATIARMYRARQSGLKKEMFGYLPGGYARVLEEYARHLTEQGVCIRCSTRVQRVEQQSDGGVQVEYADGGAQDFDRVVLTIPSSAAARLCPQLSTAETEAHQDIQYLGIICASVVLKRPLAKYYVTNITDSWVPFTAVVEMTALVDPLNLSGHHLVYLPRYVEPTDPAWQWSDVELQEQFVQALERMYPHFSREDVESFRISRVRQVMALPTLGYSRRLPPLETSLKNIFVVNSAQIVKGTLNVNEVIEVAENAFQKALLPTVAAPNNSATALISRDNYDEDARQLVTRSG